MMNDVKRMVEEVVDRISPMMNEKGYHVEYESKVDNGIERHGILVREKNVNSSIGAVLYYDPEWIDMEDDRLIERLVVAIEQRPDLKVSDFMDREYVLNNVKPMIQDIANVELLKDTDLLYVTNECFVTLFYIPIKNDTEDFHAHAKVRKTFLKSLKIFEEELIEYAMENLERDLKIRSMEEILSEMMGSEVPRNEDQKMYVISNGDTFFGAAGVLLDETYKKLSPILGSAFIILPSSLHECIAVPYMGEKEEFLQMVTEVNKTQVSNEDKLADHVYIRDKEGVHTLL